MEVKTDWNSTVELIERVNQFQEFTHEWLQNPKYSDYLELITTKDEWTLVKYVLDIFTPFRDWTLWMLQRHLLTLHHSVSEYNDMFDQLDCLMRALVKRKTPLKEDFSCAVKLAR